MNLENVEGGGITCEDGLQVMMVDTSRGASCAARNLLDEYTTSAAMVRAGIRAACNAPEPVREEDEPDLSFSSDEGFPFRKSGNAATRAARKTKKKMQKMSRRANR